MCGIVAAFSREGSICEQVLAKGTASLRHRGPDGQRQWVSRDRRAGLGHARLSIIDLKTGDQPLTSEDQNLRIVVNGELYGYEAIRNKLQNAGHRLATQSDSEIALHLYEDLGVHCLQHLRGEFALVLWDERNQTVFAARDRFGIKPLFYAFHNETLYFASEVKALFAMGVPARWNKESVYYYLEIGGYQARTLFEGVFQVPPGHFLIATGSRVQVTKYWDFDYPATADPSRTRSDSEYAEEFRAAFDEAVRVRLRADVPVGCYLSGGIDSCAILAMAARHHPKPIRAFTLAFDVAEYDESSIAKEMAQKVSAEFVPVPIRQDELADHFADAVHQSEALCINAHGVAKYLLSRAVRESGYKVVLTGEGSDEILGGYLHFCRDVMAANRISQTGENSGANRFAGTQAMSRPNGNRRSLDGVNALLGFVPAWIQTSAVQSAKIHAVLTDGFLESFSGTEGFRSFLNDIDVPSQLAGRAPLHQSLYLWAKTRLPNYLLTILGDRMEMGHSVEGRVPFLDHYLVQVMRSQPIEQKIRGTVQKYVLRESMRGVVTDAIYRRPKHVFQTPPSVLNLSGRLSVMIQETLRSSALQSVPFFDRKKVIQLLDGVRLADENSAVASDQVLMVALSACVLQSRFNLSA